MVAHEKQNKMGLNSVAMIVAPNLFLCTNKSQPTLQEIKQAQGTVNIVRMLIKYQAILWTVSYTWVGDGGEWSVLLNDVIYCMYRRHSHLLCNSKAFYQTLPDSMFRDWIAVFENLRWL